MKARTFFAFFVSLFAASTGFAGIETDIVGTWRLNQTTCESGQTPVWSVRRQEMATLTFDGTTMTYQTVEPYDGEICTITSYQPYTLNNSQLVFPSPAPSTLKCPSGTRSGFMEIGSGSLDVQLISGVYHLTYKEVIDPKFGSTNFCPLGGHALRDYLKVP